jgi:hypothetical protein
MPPMPPVDTRDFEKVKWKGQARLRRDGSVWLNVDDMDFQPGSPPSVNLYDHLLIDPERYAQGVERARQKGWISNAEAREMAAQAPQVQALAAERRRLMAQAGSDPQLKAILGGSTKGLAELGAGFGVGRLAAAPFAEAPPLAAGVGIVAGGLASFGAGKLYDKALAKMARSNSLAASLEASGKLHPAYAQGGELAAMLIPVPGSLAKLARAANAAKTAGGTAAAAGYVTRQLAAKAGASVAGDAAVRLTGQALGMPGMEITPGSMLNAAGFGALSGHGEPGGPVPEGGTGPLPARPGQRGSNPRSYSYDPHTEVPAGEGNPKSYSYEGGSPGGESSGYGHQSESGEGGMLETTGPMPRTGPNFQASLGTKIVEARGKVDQLLQKMGITAEDDPDLRVKVWANDNPPVRVNLPFERIYNNATRKSKGNLDAAQSIADNTHQEEYYHVADVLSDYQQYLQWKQAGGKGNFPDYRDRLQDQRAANIQTTVDQLPPQQRQDAIHTLLTLWRNYHEMRDDHNDTALWDEINNDPAKQRRLVSESVRQLAHYADARDNSETGYLQYLDPQKFAERQAFYDRAVQQANVDTFGPLFRRALERTSWGAKNPNSLSIAP